MVIGVQKAGTWSLHRYLSCHPSLLPGEGPAPGYGKEINFFDNDQNYSKGRTWYHSHFPFTCEVEAKDAMTFEATTEYIFFPWVAERVFHYNPQMKLIVLLRDPVHRAFSAWNMHQFFAKQGPCYPYYHLRETRPFSSCVLDEWRRIKSGTYSYDLRSYLKRGYYYEQFVRYLVYFPIEKIFVEDCSHLLNNTALVLDEIAKFLEIPQFDWNKIELPILNTGDYDRAMSNEMIDFLSDLYAPHNDDLYRLLGRNFGWS